MDSSWLSVDKLFDVALTRFVEAKPDYVFERAKDLEAAWHCREEAKKAHPEEMWWPNEVLDEALCGLMIDSPAGEIASVLSVLSVRITMQNVEASSTESTDANLPAATRLQLCVRIHTSDALPFNLDIPLQRLQSVMQVPKMHEFAEAFFKSSFTVQAVTRPKPFELLSQPCLEVWFDTLSMRLAIQIMQIGSAEAPAPLLAAPAPVGQMEADANTGWLGTYNTLEEIDAELEAIDKRMKQGLQQGVTTEGLQLIEDLMRQGFTCGCCCDASPSCKTATET